MIVYTVSEWIPHEGPNDLATFTTRALAEQYIERVKIELPGHFHSLDVYEVDVLDELPDPSGLRR